MPGDDRRSGPGPAGHAPGEHVPGGHALGEHAPGGDPRGDRPPAVRLQSLLDGMRVTKVLHVLAELKVADHLADGPRDVPALARDVGADPDALYRVLRCAASYGVFAETPDGRFGLTSMAELLRSDVEQSHRDLVMLVGGDLWWRPYEELAYAVRTGRSAAEHVFGRPFYAHLRSDAEASARFDRAMTQMSLAQARAILARYSFAGYRRIADIGGGHGYFLSQVLLSSPDTEGLLFDQEHVVAGAGPVLDKHGVADRTTVVAGDFFTEIPGGCDAYLLKAILINWPDDRAVRILRAVRAAIGEAPGARLFVIEPVVAPGNARDYSKALDVDMLVNLGGRQRTTEEWRRLIAEGGFELIGEPAPGRREVLECRPR
ncbi:methyltransferase [Actinoallomurus vinaceus]|uniref:Methyltransferase n=1 Tax=Actinoallomurus vinaceus TaxID=1080074 RepID=A0ABP8USF1_9ACTN